MTEVAEEIQANADWELIKSLPMPFRIVDFPRKDPVTGNPVTQLHMKLLSQSELCKAIAGTHRYAIEMLQQKDGAQPDPSLQGYEDLYANESCVQLLYLACKRLDKTHWPFFATPKEMRELPNETIAMLFREYLLLKDEFSPEASAEEPEEESDA